MWVVSWSADLTRSRRLAVQERFNPRLQLGDLPVDVGQDVADVAELVEVGAAFLQARLEAALLYTSPGGWAPRRHICFGCGGPDRDVPVNTVVTSEEIAGAVGLPVWAQRGVPAWQRAPLVDWRQHRHRQGFRVEGTGGPAQMRRFAGRCLGLVQRSGDRPGHVLRRGEAQHPEPPNHGTRPAQHWSSAGRIDQAPAVHPGLSLLRPET